MSHPTSSTFRGGVIIAGSTGCGVKCAQYYLSPPQALLADLEAAASEQRHRGARRRARGGGPAMANSATGADGGGGGGGGGGGASSIGGVFQRFAPFLRMLGEVSRRRPHLVMS